jgi:GT2 family glycosyltransferase
VFSADAELTVVVAPREKYRRAVDVFQALEEDDGPPFRLIWVDEARAPRAYRRRFEARARQPGVTHLSLPSRAGANECRMHGFRASHSPYVLFLDNDAFPAPGAFGSMLECMRTTNASFVSPLILNRDGSVHHAGGTTAIVADTDGRQLLEVLPSQTHPLATAELVRGPTSALEMHCVLVRAQSLVRAGGFDTRLLSSMDCADLSLRLQATDGPGWFEPAATVSYDSTAPGWSDVTLFLGRWSRSTVEHDIAQFARTWHLDLHDARLDAHRGFLRARCMRTIRYARGAARRVFGPTAAARVENACDPVFDLFSDARPRAGLIRGGSRGSAARGV